MAAASHGMGHDGRWSWALKNRVVSTYSLRSLSRRRDSLRAIFPVSTHVTQIFLRSEATATAWEGRTYVAISDGTALAHLFFTSTITRFSP